MSLSIELVQKFVFNEQLTWTLTTNGYKFYTFNLYKWLTERAKVPWKLMIVCGDKESYSFFKREGISCISLEGVKESHQTNISSFGTDSFKVWNRIKLDLLRWIVMNANTLGVKKSMYIDGDIIIQKDPWVYIPDTTDVLFQCDCGKADELHTDSKCNSPCSGFIVHNHTIDLSKLYVFDKIMWKDSLEQDQPYIQTRLKVLNIPFNTLDRKLYGNGIIQKSGLWKTDDWVLLHYNYRVGDTKKQAMKANNHWLVPY